MKDIQFRSEAAGMSNPAIIVIGEVVALSSEKINTLINQEFAQY